LTEKRSINSSSKDGTSRKKYWKEFIFNGEVGEYFIVTNMRQYLRNDYKLIRTQDIITEIINRYTGRIKYCKTTPEYGFWVIGYLSTNMSSKYLTTYTDPRQDGNYEFKTFLWKNLQVPDFDYYKTNHPEQFTTYMTWIEQNMKNKDVFLAGIDEQFQKLIGEKS